MAVACPSASMLAPPRAKGDFSGALLSGVCYWIPAWHRLPLYASVAELMSTALSWLPLIVGHSHICATTEHDHCRRSASEGTVRADASGLAARLWLGCRTSVLNSVRPRRAHDSFGRGCGRPIIPNIGTPISRDSALAQQPERHFTFGTRDERRLAARVKHAPEVPGLQLDALAQHHLGLKRGGLAFS